MEKLDQKLISIFQTDEFRPEMHQALRDIALLSGVLNDLGSQNFLQTPIEILRFLRIIQLINEEAEDLISIGTIGLIKAIESSGRTKARSLLLLQPAVLKTKSSCI